jgi:hypothetical protein
MRSSPALTWRERLTAHGKRGEVAGSRQLASWLMLGLVPVLGDRPLSRKTVLPSQRD